MSLPRTATDLVPGDIGGLLAAALAHDEVAREVGLAQTTLSDTVTGTSGCWSGPASDGFRATGTAQATLLTEVIPLAGDAAAAYRTLAAALESLRAQADDVLAQSVSLGLPPGALTGDPWAVARHLLANPDHAAALARLITLIVAIRIAAGEAHNAFVVAIAGATTRLAERADELRGPDERGGRRIRNDGGTRRDERGIHFDNDWAGRAILERYLRGGGDWTIDGDDDWSEYMMANESLRVAMAGRTGTAAQEALIAYLSTGQQQGSFDTSFSQAIENGEGIVGYQYLHGTNADVGGFEHSGSTVVTPLPDGTYQVTIDASYTWNDVIDPNPEYSTDRWKSTLAEVLTLGQADAYDIHITWGGPTTLVLDAAGNVISIDGYPG